VEGEKEATETTNIKRERTKIVIMREIEKLPKKMRRKWASISTREDHQDSKMKRRRQMSQWSDKLLRFRRSKILDK
jgi:hypothetical protein